MTVYKRKKKHSEASKRFIFFHHSRAQIGLYNPMRKREQAYIKK
ncbi:hypothetical protein HMPREF0083_02780 [Aneurinibacillus aneurinilyticus ATCC 12856]|uniref:Uncharacterized protein n=1 Tax=Aneurinibacillus aneurinilyticus ATCC 12856 TaxID=649747 RepID=U1X2D0_ANEAE|nr:hypothetical protein HMPREF0083_02780 [Aneurinibacillus aneurinilyticus ATCC 12856]